MKEECSDVELRLSEDSGEDAEDCKDKWHLYS